MGFSCPRSTSTVESPRSEERTRTTAKADGVVEDLVDAQAPSQDWQASPITTINGQDVVDYLTQFAAVNTIGCLEPHADWNQLMSSPALTIQNSQSIFNGYTTFYPGENITFTFENGTRQELPWLALYNGPGPTGPLATGGDFYNFFVLGLYPASFQPDDPTSNSSLVPSASSTAASLPTAISTLTSWPDPAYPRNPDVVQPDLGLSGVLTGYFFNESSTAVLSIPSFDVVGDAAANFSLTVTEFLVRSRDAGLKRVIIDLQQNAGGETLLAFDTFKQVGAFPPIPP